MEWSRNYECVGGPLNGGWVALPAGITRHPVQWYDPPAPGQRVRPEDVVIVHTGWYVADGDVLRWQGE